MTCELANEEVELLSDRALSWPAGRTLFVADVHWGKAAALRAGQIAIPGGTTARDLQRLTALLETTQAERLGILGDAFHAKAGMTDGLHQQLQTWREQHAGVEILMVRGNHDRRAGDPAGALNFTVVDEPYPLQNSPFVLAHDPGAYPEHPAGYVLAGHVHPGVRLSGKGRGGLRLPAFLFRPGGAILPAFGSLTGLADPAPTEADRVYVIAEEEIVRVN